MIFQNIGKSCLDRAALALIDLMRQYRAAVEPGSLVEEVPPLCTASVVDDDKVLKAFLQKAFNHIYEFFVRVEGRQNDCHACPAIQVL